MLVDAVVRTPETVGLMLMEAVVRTWDIVFV